MQQLLLPVEKRYDQKSHFTMTLTSGDSRKFNKELGTLSGSGRIKTGQYILGGGTKSSGSYDDLRPSHRRLVQWDNTGRLYGRRDSTWGSTQPSSTSHTPSGYASLTQTDFSWWGSPNQGNYLGGYNPRSLPNGVNTGSCSVDYYSRFGPGGSPPSGGTTMTNTEANLNYDRAPCMLLQTQRIG